MNVMHNGGEGIYELSLVGWNRVEIANFFVKTIRIAILHPSIQCTFDVYVRYCPHSSPRPSLQRYPLQAGTTEG